MALPDENLSPFQRAAAEALKARAAAAKEAAAPAAPAVAPSVAAPGRAVFGGAAGQTAARAPFLATESAQFLRAQQARMENARREAERQRLHLEVERHKSHIFIKRQELSRVATRLRSAESSLVAAEADARRASSSLGATAGAIHEKSDARSHLAMQREAAERDFERREIAESKAVEAINRDMDKMARRAGKFVMNTPEYRDLERRKKDRERGLASIRLERSRRRNEASAKDAGLARQLANAERGELAGRRAADLAESLAAKYRLQVRAFSVAKQALDADLERMHQELARAEMAMQRASLTASRV
jgi:hypothetical protein